MLLGRDLAQILVPCGSNEAEVAVALDHAGHQGASRPVDHVPRAALVDMVSAARDRRDPVSFDQHLAGAGGVLDTVPDGDVAEKV